MEPEIRRAILRHPRTGATWDLGLLEPPFEAPDVALEGLVVVAEPETGMLRSTVPLEVDGSLGEALAPAFLEPAHPTRPGRPQRIRCVDRSFARRVALELQGLGIEIEATGPLPSLDEIAASLAEHFEVPRAPGISTSLGLWAAVLRRLCKLAPWRQVSDGVTFRFRGVQALEGRVALVLGQAEEQLGVVLYASEEAYEQFEAQGPEPDLDAISDVEVLCLYLDPEDEFLPDEVEDCRKLDFALPGACFPLVAAMRGARLVKMDETEQRTLLAAVEAVLGLCESDLARLEHEPAVREVRTCLGLASVSSTPAVAFDEPETLAKEPYVVGIGVITAGEDGAQTLPALVVKQDKRLARRLAERMADVDAVSVEPAGEGAVAYRAWAGIDTLGVIAVASSSGIHDLVPGGEAWLAVAAGGSKRPTMRMKDMLFLRRVTVLADRRS